MINDLVKELRQFLTALISWEKSNNDLLREIRLLLEEIKHDNRADRRQKGDSIL